MAGRTFTPSDLVSLPRLNAAEAVALMVSLESAAKPHAAELSNELKQALASLKGARASFQQARTQRRRTVPKVDPKKTREADTTLDRCWRAFEQWTGALRLIPEAYVEERAQLDVIYEALFGEGMGFLNDRFEIEWAESDTRLDLIKKEGFATTVEKLGGQVFLQAIRDAHRVYGELLGITVAPSKTDSVEGGISGEAFRQTFLQAQQAIRAYVAEVAVLSHRPEASGQQMAASLLKPLAEWSSRPASAEEDEPDEPLQPVDGEPQK